MISSVNALCSFGLPAYSAAKSGLYGFMNATVDEFGNDNIRINTLSLGTVVTPATQKEPKDFGGLKKGTALGKFVEIETVSKFVYQISNDLVQMTGQNLVLDAGQTKVPVK